MSGSESPRLDSSASSKSEPTQSSAHSPADPETVYSPTRQDASSSSATNKSLIDTALSEKTAHPMGVDLTRQQLKWVFAATCYAYGAMKRDFSTPIDQELIVIIKNKLDDEPGFHNDTIDFGNNQFQDQLEQVVADTWERIFLDKRPKGCCYPDLFDDSSRDDNNTKAPPTIVQTSDHRRRQNGSQPKSGSPTRRHQSSATDDNTSASSAMDQNKATPNSSSGGDTGSNGDLSFNETQVRKVYLGGLSDDIEETDLQEYFKEYGTIADINIVLHKDTGKRRGFAFVEYDDHEPVDRIVSKKFHTIKGRRIEAKKAIPKVEMDARKRVDPRVALTDAVMAFHSGAPAYHLWDSLAGPYAPPLHAPGPPPPPQSGSYHLDHRNHHGHHYSPHHYHYGGGAGAATGAGGNGAGGGPAGWLMHGSGARGSSAYHANSASGWASSVASAAAAAAAASEYSRGAGLPMDAVAAVAAGGIGPLRSISYSQHSRGYRPYANGGGSGQRSRGFK